MADTYEKGRAAFASGAYARALSHFRQVLQARAGHAGAVKSTAQCYLRLGRPCTALRWFKRYQGLRPNDFFVKRHIQTLSARCSK